MGPRFFMGLAALGLILGGPAGAGAADVPQSELLLFEEPTIVAAAKREQTAREAPASVTIVTREEIRRFGYRTLGEVLRGQRGFYTTDDRNYTYVGVRGFLRTGDYNDRILLLVDGHTYNDDVYQGAFFGHEFGIDLELVERVEIARGPGSALYGGNALFAVVNVVTIDPADAPRAELGAETGSFERKRGRFTLSHRFENGLAVMAAGSVLDLDGQDRLEYRLDHAEDGPTFAVAEDADGERAVAFFLSARWGDFRFRGGTNRREKTIPTGSFDTILGDPDNETTDSRSFAELGWQRRLENDVDLDARAFYDGSLYRGTYVYGDDSARTKFRDRSDSHWFGGEVRATRRFFLTHRLVAGAEMSVHPSAEQRASDDGELVFADDRSFESYGLYLQDEWDVIRTVRLVAGGRFDESYGRQSELSPRAALLWSPRLDTTVKLLYGRAFRSPNLYERYYVSDSDLGNPGLEEERIETYEVVGEWRDERLEVVASVYHYDVDDLIDLVLLDADDPTGIRRFENRDDAHATGGEIEAHVALPHGVTARLAYSHQRVKVSGERAANSPRHLASAGFLFDLPWRTRGGAELLVVGPRRTLARRSTDTAIVPNLTLVARTPIPGLEADLSLYNFLDQPYADPAGAEHRQDRIPRDRFAFRVGLRWTF